MASSRRAVFAIAVGAWLVASPREAHAEAASRLRIQYDAPKGCPSRDEFVTALDARIRKTWVDGSDTRSFDVRVVQRADRTFVGRLEIRQLDQRTSAREIQDESCRAITTSLAVFLAIALDPSSSPSDGDRATAPPHEDVLVSPPPSLSRPVRVKRRRAPAPPSVDRPRWTWSAGIAASYQRTSESSWGGRVHAELSRSFDRVRLAPTLRVSWGWSDFSTFPPRAGEAKFRLKSVRVDAGARFVVAPFVFTASVGMDAGSLEGRTDELVRSAPLSSPWVAGVGTLRAAVFVTPWLALELSTSLLVPFERRLYVLMEPDRFVFRSPSALFEGSAGIVAAARFR